MLEWNEESDVQHKHIKLAFCKEATIPRLVDQQNGKHIQTLLAKGLKALIDVNHIIEIVSQGCVHLGVTAEEIPRNYCTAHLRDCTAL